MGFKRGETGQPWTSDEVDLVVAEYFRLYASINSGESSNKSQVYKSLASRLEVRSPGSVASKMGNISAVMARFGWPELPGIGSRPHIQAALIPAVQKVLESKVDLLDPVAHAIVTEPGVVGPVDLFLAPTQKFGKSIRASSRLFEVSPVKRDYLAIEAKNRLLGMAGEMAVLRFERLRLEEQGRFDLSRKIQHVSKELGDGLGYDIESFEVDGRDRLIEVKTTRGGRHMPFYVTRRELEVSTERAEAYVLARVFDFPGGTRRSAPGMFEARGAISERFILEPESFKAVDLSA